MNVDTNNLAKVRNKIYIVNERNEAGENFRVIVVFVDIPKILDVLDFHDVADSIGVAVNDAYFKIEVADLKTKRV